MTIDNDDLNNLILRIILSKVVDKTAQEELTESDEEETNIFSTIMNQMQESSDEDEFDGLDEEDKEDIHAFFSSLFKTAPAFQKDCCGSCDGCAEPKMPDDMICGSLYSKVGDSFGDRTINDNNPFTFKNQEKAPAEKADTDKSVSEYDAVQRPRHYNQSLLEPMEKFMLRYHDRPDYIKGAFLFNIDKYTERAGLKGDKKQDEDKASFYLKLFMELFPEDAEYFKSYRNWQGKAPFGE